MSSLFCKVCLAFLAFFFAVLVIPAAAANLYVDSTGSNLNNCLAQESPCQTLQGAINKSADGDVIFVAAGNYLENLIVDKDISIRGPNAGIPLGVDPGSRLPEAYLRGQALVSASGVSFDGLFFLRPDIPLNSSARLITATEAGPLLLANSGFDLGSFADPSIAACGSAISGSAFFTIEDSSFEDQIYSSCTIDAQASRMIYITDSGRIDLSESRFSNSSQSVYLAGQGGDVVRGNEFLGSTSGGVFLGAEGITISGNTFSGYGGLQIDGADGSTISNNLFSESNLVALLLEEAAADLEIKENAFLGALLTPDPRIGATILNYSESLLDLNANAWGSNNYPGIENKIYLSQGSSALSDLWIEEYIADSSKNNRPGFWPLVKQFAWQVETSRGLARQIGPFFTGRYLSLNLSGATASGKNIIEAYDANSPVSDSYPITTAPPYLGNPATYYTISGDLGQAPAAQVCLDLPASSFPSFISPEVYAYGSAWEKKTTTKEGDNLCAETSSYAALASATAGALPQSLEPPRLLHQVQIRKRIETSPGSWRAYPLLGQDSYSYQWQRSRAYSGPWSNISGETEKTYFPGDRDVGGYLRIRLRASNSLGQGQAFSSPRYVQASGRKTFHFSLRKAKVQLLANGKVLFARLACLEGYCQIRKASATISYKGQRRVAVIYRKTTLIPGEIRNVYLKLPASLYREIPRGQKIKATLSLAALSSNRQSFSKKISGRLFK